MLNILDKRIYSWTTDMLKPVEPSLCLDILWFIVTRPVFKQEMYNVQYVTASILNMHNM